MPDGSGQGDPEYQAKFPPEARSARTARHFVLCLGWSDDPEVNHRLSTAVSELVTNAILHARTPFTVQVTPADGAIRVSVKDQSPVQPSIRSYRSIQPTGRGMRIVESMVDRWGVSNDRDGKSVWFELQREPAFL